MVIIMNAKKENGYFSCEGMSDKKSAFVFMSKEGRISICTMNASAKRNGYLGGRTFRNTEEAIAAYKSADVKNIIKEAARLSCI